MQTRESVPKRSRAMLVMQIPQRTAELGQRGVALCENGWDINLALLLAEDTEALASTSRMLGESSMIAPLEEFADCLWNLLDPPTVPDEQALAAIHDLLKTIIAGSDVSVAASANAVQPTLFAYAASEENGFPLLVRPPAEYWRRFTDGKRQSGDERVASPASAPAEGPAAIEAKVAIVEPVTLQPATTSVDRVDADVAKPEPNPEPLPGAVDMHETLRVFHVGDGGALAHELDLKLRAEGYESCPVTDIAELKNQLARVPPSLIILGSKVQASIEEIGALVLGARARSGRHITLIAMATESDLGTRLRALRAGCDALFVPPTSATEIMTRVRELAAVDRADPYRVMIIEDDRAQAMFAESILRKNGMLPLAIADASRVLDQLDAFRPDLILMDLHMPECDGMELTALIREREAFLYTPIIFLSGEDDTEKHYAAINAGGDDFLSKPIAPRHLITAVSSRVRRARALEQRRHRPAPHTPTRGLHDITQLRQRLGDMLAMEDGATRNGGLLYIELEDARHLQGQMGASAIEILVSRLAAALVDQIGNNDLLARCGDSGLLLLNPDRSSVSLERYASVLREHIGEVANRDSSPTLRASALIGICPFIAIAGDANAMIDAAERAMLEARSPASGGVFMHKPKFSPRNDEKLAEALRTALDQSQFHIIYQPIVSLHGEEDEQFQALLRLPTENGRIYAASELVPAAERAGLIAEVDRWMLEHCLAAIAAQARDGRRLRLFVSQSLASVRDPQRTEWLRGALDSHQVPAEQVSLELRIGDALEALPEVVAFTLAMKKIGVGLTLAGFESSTNIDNILDQLPVDFLKLSARYSSGHDEGRREELREIVRLAHANGRRVIAPRVEEARVAAALWSSGIDLIQGNFVQQAARDMSYDFHASIV